MPPPILGDGVWNIADALIGAALLESFLAAK